MAVDEDFDGQEPEDPSELVKHLRAQIKQRNKDLEAEKGARRELAFVKAGVDTSTKLGQLFAKSYEGDVNDVEAIAAEARELGVLKVLEPTAETTAPAAPTTPEPPADTSASERSALANGAPADDGSGIDPRQAGLARAQDSMKRGATFEDAAGSFIRDLANAAMAGDQRVIVRGQAF